MHLPQQIESDFVLLSCLYSNVLILTFMASSQPSALCAAAVMSSSEESSVVQVMDSREPLVAACSSGASCVQVLDSSEPVAHILACDQVLDSSEPLVHHIEPVAGCSRNLDDDMSSFHFVACDPDMSSSTRGTTSVATLRSCMNIVQLFEELGTTEQCITFAEEEGLLPTEKLCTHHKRPMNLRTTGAGSYGAFRCKKVKCRNKSASRAKGTWFENTKLAITTMFHLMYMFCYNYPLELARHNARNKYDPIVSPTTVTNYYSYCRDTIVTYEQEKTVEKPKIGGPGKIVQIDESNFGGHWVIGMIENNSDDLRLEVCPDNERSAEVLVPLIQKHVEEGTEIHTDSWSAYDCLSQYGYIHKKVNHSDHTQRIKSHWQCMKATYRKHKIPGDFKDWLVEYRWRQRIKVEKKCAFRELINAIKHVYKIKKGR